MAKQKKERMLPEQRNWTVKELHSGKYSAKTEQDRKKESKRSLSRKRKHKNSLHDM